MLPLEAFRCGGGYLKEYGRDMSNIAAEHPAFSNVLTRNLDSFPGVTLKVVDNNQNLIWESAESAAARVAAQNVVAQQTTQPTKAPNSDAGTGHQNREIRVEYEYQSAGSQTIIASITHTATSDPALGGFFIADIGRGNVTGHGWPWNHTASVGMRTVFASLDSQSKPTLLEAAETCTHKASEVVLTAVIDSSPVQVRCWLSAASSDGTIIAGTIAPVVSVSDTAFLTKIGEALHDGPLQTVSVAYMRLSAAIFLLAQRTESEVVLVPMLEEVAETLGALPAEVRQSLQTVLQEALGTNAIFP